MDSSDQTPEKSRSFFEQPHVQVERIAIGQGIPLGIERVFNPQVGIGGAYGSWGESYDNEHLPKLLETRLGEPLSATEKLNLSELGFLHRHHLAVLPDKDDIELEIQVGVRFLRAAAEANGWEPSEVQGVLIGTSGPATEDYTERIAREAGIPDSALKVSIHKACDGSVGGLNLALNPGALMNMPVTRNLSEEL
jgi:hypothetical protein